MRDLNRDYRETPALWKLDTDPAGFHLDRRQRRQRQRLLVPALDGTGSALACIANFSPMPHEGYRLGLPEPGRWDEVINTDADAYGGSGVGNLGAVEATAKPWHGLPASATLQLPPLGALWLRHTP